MSEKITADTKNETASTKPRTASKKKKRDFTVKDIPWGLVRLALAIIVMLVIGNTIYPHAQSFVEEQYASKAVSKGRVLLRGAQIVATEKLVEGDSWEAAEKYLCDAANLENITKAAKFPVVPVKISKVKLDKKGIIESFECVIDYEYRRYSISFDLTKDESKAELLEKLEKPKKSEKSE